MISDNLLPKIMFCQIDFSTYRATAQEKLSERSQDEYCYYMLLFKRGRFVLNFLFLISHLTLDKKDQWDSDKSNDSCKYEGHLLPPPIPRIRQ